MRLYTLETLLARQEADKSGGGSPPAEGTKPAEGAAPAEGAKPAEGEKPAEGSVLAGAGKEGEKPKEGEQPKDGEKPKEGEAPVALKVEDLKLPEGVKPEDVNPEQFKAFSEIIADPKLDAKGRAQALVDLHTKITEESAAAPYKLWEETQNKWVKELAADKEIGSGDEKKPLKPEISKAVAQVIDKVGGDELRAALDYTGAGNNPVVVRAFVSMSKFMTEGGRQLEGSPTNAKEKPKTGAQAIWPNLAEGQSQQKQE